MKGRRRIENKEVGKKERSEGEEGWMKLEGREEPR